MRNAERGTRNSERKTHGVALGRLSSRVPSPAFRVLAASLMLLLVPGFAAAQTADQTQLVDVRVGFDGAYKLGCWTPVELTYAGGTETLTGVVSLIVPDGDGMPVLYASQPLQITAGRSTSTVVYVRFGQFGDAVKVIFVAAGHDPIENTLEAFPQPGALELPYPLSADERLVVVIGAQPSLLSAASSLALGYNREVLVTTIDDPRRLPTQARGYEAADAVVLAPNRPERFAALPADAAQVSALRQWVEFGGRLATIVTAASQPLFTAGGSLAEFAGGDVGPSAPLPGTAALEKSAGSDVKQSISPAALRKSPLYVPRLSVDGAVVVAAEGDLPLIVRRAAGLGGNTLMSFSLEHPLLTEWSGRQALARQLLVTLGVVSEREAKATSGSQAYYGYDDLGGQLRGALDRYEGVQVISFFWLAVMVIAYLGLIGPADYLLVRKVFKRPELTWITFPTIVICTSLGAYYLAIYLKGERLRVSRADVIDCDAATGAVRSTSWAGVFSPVGKSYQVQFDGTLAIAAATDVDESTMWLGLTGGGLGGMHAGGGATWFTQPYAAVDGLGLSGVPIEVWSSKMFAGRGVGRAGKALHEPLSTGLDRRLSGALKNPFPCELTEALLCYGGRAYELGTLKPGEARELSSLDVRDLQYVLQDWRVAQTANKNPVYVGQAHDPGSREVDDILRKLMFYAAAGGEEHAQLKNRQLAELDLSPLLGLHRAVLLARIDPQHAGALNLTVDGGDAPERSDVREAFLRLVIPVAEARK